MTEKTNLEELNTAEKLRKTFKECEEDNTVPHNRCSYQISYWASRRELRGYLKALDDVENKIQQLNKDDMYDKYIEAYNNCIREIKELRG